jgi:tRNA threonylcarbamoyladenosine biosynthesis protein TsaE
LDLHTTSLSDLPKTAASQIIQLCGGEQNIFFYGDMGAGKTTLIKSLCGAGRSDSVTSPTFSIVNEYKGRMARFITSIFTDLKGQNEALDMGYEEYFYSDNYCFIEWPEKIAGLIPDSNIPVCASMYQMQPQANNC